MFLLLVKEMIRDEKMDMEGHPVRIENVDGDVEDGYCSGDSWEVSSSEEEEEEQVVVQPKPKRTVLA